MTRARLARWVYRASFVVSGAMFRLAKRLDYDAVVDEMGSHTGDMMDDTVAAMVRLGEARRVAGFPPAKVEEQ